MKDWMTGYFLNPLVIIYTLYWYCLYK